MTTFVGQGKIKSRKLNFFISQYLVEFFRWGHRFLHVMIIFIGFKINKHMVSQDSFVDFQGGTKRPPQDFVYVSDVRAERVKVVMEPEL